MKIDLKVLNSQQTEATTGSKKMKLSENAASMVFQLFTKNVYSNPIGTVVREITSNCFDSHVEAETNGEKIDAPVVIKKSYDKETSTHYISFIDYGVGMSPKRVEEVYMVYFESTKRVDNTQIGGFGIGGKTPLAYKRTTGQGEGEYDNSFYVITNHDGTKYYYCIYEGAESPEVNLLQSEPTTEHNGTEVRVPVLEKDVSTFEREMKRQLYYFESIVFEGFETKDEEGNVIHKGVDNDYQIIRGKSFWYRGSSYDSKMHVCLGRVAYPIDYSAMNIDYDDYKLPVAIKLDVGDIGVTASRENLDYSEKTIKIIKKKLEEVKAELVDLLKVQYDNVQTLTDYFEVKENFGHLRFPNDTSIYIGSVISKEDVDYTNFKYNFMQMPDDAQLFKLLFEAKLYGKKESKGYYSRHSFQRNYKSIQEAGHLYYVDDEFQRKVIKQAWLKSEHERYYIISKISLDELHLSDVCDMFNVHLDDKLTKAGKPVSFIKSLLEMQEEYFEVIRANAESYDRLEVPADFIEDRKRERLSVDILNTTIPVKFVSGYYRNGTRPKIEHLVKFTGTVIYGFKDDDDSLRSIYNLYKTLFDGEKMVTSYSSYNNKGFETKGGLMVVQISQANEKYMKFCQKAYHVKDAYWKLLHRKKDFVLSHFMTYALEDKYGEVDGLYLEEVFARLSPKWYNKIQVVKKYMESLPEKATNLDGDKYDLQKYFDIEDIEYTEEQKGMLKKIEEILELQKKNVPVLEHINMPYHIENLNDTLIMILAKVMSF